MSDENKIDSAVEQEFFGETDTSCDSAIIIENKVDGTKLLGRQEAGAVEQVISIPSSNAMQSQSVHPGALINLAMSQENFDLAKLEGLFELQKKYEAHEAEKAFHVALSEFKRNPPKVVKDKLNKQYGSNYTSLGNMVNTVNEALGEHGLSARWEFPKADAGQVTVVCVLSHTLGHEKRVELTAPVDDSGKKNLIQGPKSTRTYLKLETFEAVTGIASADGNLDDDGNAAGIKAQAPMEFVSEKQAADLQALHEEVGGDASPIFNHFHATDWDGIPANRYHDVVKKLEGRRK